MANSITLSNMSARFAKDSSHLGKQDPYLDLEFGGRVYKTTMVKGGGVQVAWSQPILLEGAAAGDGLLKVVAKAHKALLKDKTLGEGTVNLTQAAQTGGLTTVQLSSLLGTNKHAGQVFFNVQYGAQTGAGHPTGHQAGGNVVEGVGGDGRTMPDNAPLPGTGGTGAGFGAGGPSAGLGVPGAGVGTGGFAGNAPNAGQGGGFGGQQGVNNGGFNNSAPGGGLGGTGGQLIPQGQQGMQTAQPGIQGGQPGFQQGSLGVGQQQGGIGGQARPQIHEQHNHSVHDHNESESSETHRIG